jgi:F-type H+-transporting ATPase subunit epsilon
VIMYLEIITPEEVLFKGQISSVQLPGKDGLFQILKDHAPIISSLRAGTVKIRVADDTRTLDHLSSQVILDTSDDKLCTVEVKGGVLECKNNMISVLAS